MQTRSSALALAVLGVSMAQAAAFATAPSLELTGTPRACDWPHTRRGTRRIGALRASADAADEWTPLTDEASGNVYYWNKATGLTSWEKPAPRDVRAAEATGTSVSTGESEGWEKKFANFFGAIGASPEQMGMARFDRNKFPELFPATLTEFAAPVAGDDADMALFRPLLARTSLELRGLQLVYDANRDGWNARAFHERVDKLGPGVVLARTEGAFLFTWPDGRTELPAVKLRKVGGSSLACVDDPESGPRFGADGLHVPLRLDDPISGALGGKVARSKLGPYYERREDGGNSIFAEVEKNSAMLSDLKVFAGVYAADEEIPYNDALPFQLE